LTCLTELMTTQVSPVSSAWSEEAVGPGPLYTAEELAALHTHLVRRFRSMAAQHRPGCAFVAPYPNAHDYWPNEILVIPFRSDAALFSIGFLQSDRTTMLVRIGEHGVVECWEGDQAAHSLAATAELLFGIALSGRYREEIWTHTTTGRYEGGQSYFMDESQVWQELRPRKQPPDIHQLVRHKLAVQDRRYQPY
jgi:hypothetical protein